MVEVVGSIPAAPIGSKAISDKEIAFFIACFLGLEKGVNTLRVHQNVHRKLRKFGKRRAKMREKKCTKGTSKLEYFFTQDS